MGSIDPKRVWIEGDLSVTGTTIVDADTGQQVYGVKSLQLTIDVDRDEQRADLRIYNANSGGTRLVRCELVREPNRAPATAPGGYAVRWENGKAEPAPTGFVAEAVRSTGRKCGECRGTGYWNNPAGGRDARTPCSRGCRP